MSELVRERLESLYHHAQSQAAVLITFFVSCALGAVVATVVIRGVMGAN